MKSILIIGMGKFGHHLCADLIKNGNDIMVMDKDEAKVRDLIYDVTKVQIGDCTDPQVVKALGINNFDLIFVCIGTNFQSSLEITSLVKEMGGKYVISKANRDVHAKFHASKTVRMRLSILTATWQREWQRNTAPTMCLICGINDGLLNLRDKST